MKRILLALTFGVLLLVPTGSAAHAIPGFGEDCDVNFVLGSPATGPANTIDRGPEDPGTGDPFADSPRISIYEAYGYGGLQWPTFDCGVTDMGAVSDPGGSAANTLANVSLNGLSLGVGINASLQRFTFDPDTLDVFEPVMRLGAEVLGERVFRALFWITLGVTALLILVRSMRARLAESAGAAGWVVFAGLVGIMAATWPLVIAPQLDSVVTGSVGMVHTEMSDAVGTQADTPADGVTANLHHALLYETWCSGMVGRSAGETADEFCPRLWEASTLSREEYEEVAGDEGALNDLREDKEDEFNDAADDLKDADPTAYGYLVGDHNTERLWYALLGWFAFFCASPFLFVAAFLLLFSLIVLRVGIVLLPVIVIIGGFPPMRRFVTGLLDYIAGALLTAFMFGTVSAVFIAMIGGFLSPASQTHPLLAALLLLIATIACWKLTKPIRKVKNLASLRKRIQSANADQDAQQMQAADPDQPRTPSSGGGNNRFAPTMGAAWGASTVPAEAQSTMKSAAASGAVRGAVGTAAVTVMSGGTLAVPALAAGAAKGAGTAAAAQKFGGGARERAGASAQERPVQARAAEAGAPAAPGLPAGRPARARAEGPRVYTPGEHTPAGDVALVEPKTVKGERVYPIFTPEPKGANQ